MNETKWQRWNAASGLAAFVTGAIGGMMERGWPSAADPVAVQAFVSANRTPILVQSMAFALSTGFYLWFLGTLRAWLLRGEGGGGALSGITLAAGSTWAALQLAAQALQVGVAMSTADTLDGTLLWCMAALFSFSNLPLAVMLGAVALVAFRTSVLPRWIAWISVIAAAAQLLLWLAAVVGSGPLAPDGWLTYALYPVIAIWLLSTTLVMMKRS